MPKNVASSGFTAVQAGRVTGQKAPKPAKVELKDDSDSGDGKVVNMQSGNAKVGVVTDTVNGNITVTF